MHEKCSINNSIFLSPITEQEIEDNIVNIKDNTTFFDNNLTNRILKQTCKTISLPLKIIYNQSLLTGTYPTNFKKTLIVPLYKSGDIELCTNFRPISLSLTIFRIFKKCLKQRLVIFLNNHSFFLGNQFGFRKNKSTNDALLLTSNYIYSSLDKGNKVIGLFLDLKKAFDSVDHSILIKNLNIVVFVVLLLICLHLILQIEHR